MYVASSHLVETPAGKRKKLAEASFHSLADAIAHDPCYLHGVPGQTLSNAHAICMVPPLSESIALPGGGCRMTGIASSINLPSRHSLRRPMLSAWCPRSGCCGNPCYLHGVTAA